MSLEQDIQQKNFKNQKQKAFINLLYTYHHMVAKTGAIFKEYGITRQQFNVLRILRGQYPNTSSVNLIKERMLDKMSDASRIVERLRIKKLIERKQCKEDRRAVEIVITEKGLKILDQIDPIITNFEDKNIKLTDKEAEQLSILLDKFREG